MGDGGTQSVVEGCTVLDELVLDELELGGVLVVGADVVLPPIVVVVGLTVVVVGRGLTVVVVGLGLGLVVVGGLALVGGGGAPVVGTGFTVVTTVVTGAEVLAEVDVDATVDAVVGEAAVVAVVVAGIVGTLSPPRNEASTASAPTTNSVPPSTKNDRWSTTNGSSGTSPP